MRRFWEARSPDLARALAEANVRFLHRLRDAAGGREVPLDEYMKLVGALGAEKRALLSTALIESVTPGLRRA
jgi:hypothetical protein